MDRHGDETHLTAEEVRRGRTVHIMRFVLAISLLLAICALALVWTATRASARDLPGQDMIAPPTAQAHSA